MFSYEDLHQVTFSVYLERRLVRYLQTFRTALTRLYYDRNSLSRRLRNFGQSIFGFTPQVKHIDRPRPPPVDCVLKGMGLIVAVQERRSIFYIYFLKPPHSNVLRTYHQEYDSAPADIAVFIRGPQGDYGEVIIQNLLDHYNFKSLNFSSTKSPCNIPINYRLTKRYMRINYMPQNPGTHELAVLRQGYHLPGSPFLVTVDMRSQFAMPQTYGFSDDEECSKNKANRRRLRVMFRVVDFVTEKMLLTEDGRLEKLPVLTSERILAYRSSQSSSDRTCSSPGSIDSCEGQIQRLNRATNYEPPNKSNVFKTSPAKKSKIGKDYTNLLRGRWRKVMLLCRFFAKHSSDQRRIQILKAAGHIFDGRPVRLTESTLKLIEEAVSAMPNDKDDFTCQTPTDEIKYDSSLEIDVNSTTNPPQYEEISTISNNDKEIIILTSKLDASLMEDSSEVFETSKTSLSENTAQDQSMEGLRELYKSTSNVGLNLITHLEDEKDRAAITKRRIACSQYRKDATSILGKFSAPEFEGINAATTAVPIINSVDEIICEDLSSNTGKTEQIYGTPNKIDSAKYVSNEAKKGTLQGANGKSDAITQNPEEILIAKKEANISILTLELELESRGDSNKSEYLESTKHTAQLQNRSRMKIGTHNINRICNERNPYDIDEVSTDINQKDDDNKTETLSLIEDQRHKEPKEISYNANISQESYKTSSADTTGLRLTPDREESPKCRDCNVVLEIITDIETKSCISKAIPLSCSELPKEYIHEIKSENDAKEQFPILTNNEAKESMANRAINISKEKESLLQKQIQTKCPPAAVQAMIMRFENLEKDTSKDLSKEMVDMDISLQVTSVNNKELQDTLSNERETIGSKGDVNTKENKQFPMKTTKDVHQCETQNIEQQLEKQTGKATPLDLEKQNKKGQTKKTISADLNALKNEESEHETVTCNLPKQLVANVSTQRTGEGRCNVVEDLQQGHVKQIQCHDIAPVESKNLELFCSSNEHGLENNNATSGMTFSKERTEPSSILRDGGRTCVSEIQPNQERIKSHANVQDYLSNISIQNRTEDKNTLDNEYQNSAHLMEETLEQQNAEAPQHSLMGISNSILSGEIPLLCNDLPVCNTFESQLVNLEVNSNALVIATPPFSSLCSSEGLTTIANIANISGVTVSKEYPEECSLKKETDFKTAAINQHSSVKQQKVTITPTCTAHAPRNAEDVEDENKHIINVACAAKAVPNDIRGAALPPKIPSVTNNESLLHKPATGVSPFTATDDPEEIKKPKEPTKASQGIDVESLISAATNAVKHNEVIKEARMESSSNASVEIIKTELSEEKSKDCKYDSISNLEQGTNVTKEHSESPMIKKCYDIQENITAPGTIITGINSVRSNLKMNESEIVALVIGAEEQAQSPTNLIQEYSILNNLDKRFKDPVMNNEASCIASANFEEVPRCSVTPVDDSATAKEYGIECELVCSNNEYCMPEVNEFPTDFFHNDIQESAVSLKETDMKIAPTISIDPLGKCAASFMRSDAEYSIRRSDVDINEGSSMISKQSIHPDTVTEERVEILNESVDEMQKRYSAITNTDMGILSVTKVLPETATRDQEVNSSLTSPISIAEVPKYTDSEFSTSTYCDQLGENSKLLIPSEGLLPQNDITNLKDRIETLQEETLTHSICPFPELADRKKIPRPVNNEPLCADKAILYMPKQIESDIFEPAKAASKTPDVKTSSYESAFEVTEHQNELCTESLGSMTILGVKEKQKSLKGTESCSYSDISAVEDSLNDFTEVDTTTGYEMEKPTTELDRSPSDSTDCKSGSKPIEIEQLKCSREEADRPLVSTSTILNQSGGTKEEEKDLALYAVNKQSLSHVKVPHRQSLAPISTIEVPEIEEKFLEVSTTLVPVITETDISTLSSHSNSLNEEGAMNHDKSVITYEETVEVLKDSALESTHMSSADVKGDFKQDEFETKATGFITEIQNELLSSISSPSCALTCNTTEENVPDITTLPYVRNVENHFPFQETGGFETKATEFIKETQNESLSSVSSSSSSSSSSSPSCALTCNTTAENIPDITTVSYARKVESRFPFTETGIFETKATDFIKESQNEPLSSISSPSPSSALPSNTAEESIPDITTVPYVRNVENLFSFKETVYSSATDDGDDSVADLTDSKTTIPIITNQVKQQNLSIIGDVDSKASVNLIITDTEERPIILNDLNATMEFSTTTFEKERKVLDNERSTSICPAQASAEENCLALCEMNIECPISEILPNQDGRSIDPLIWSSAFTVNENSAISENAFATVVEESQSVLSVTEVEISTPLSVTLVEQAPLIFDANTDITTSANAADSNAITVVEKEDTLYRNAHSTLKDKEAVVTTDILGISKDEAKTTPMFSPSAIAEQNVILKDMEADRLMPAGLDDIKERVTVEEKGNTYSLTQADLVIVEASNELQRGAYIEPFVATCTNNVEDSGNNDWLSYLSDATGNSHPPSKDSGPEIDVRETSILYKEENITTLAGQHEETQISPTEICMWRPSSTLTNNAEETADDFKTAERGVSSFVLCEETPSLMDEIDADPLMCLSRCCVQEITTTQKENARELGENSSLKQTDDIISATQPLAEDLTLEQCNLEFHTFMPSAQYGKCSVALNDTAIPTLEYEERRSIFSPTQANIGSTISTTPLSSSTQCTISPSEDVEPTKNNFLENIDESNVTIKQTPNFKLSTDINLQSEMDLGEVDFASSRLILQENIHIAKKTGSILEDILQIDLHKNAAEAKASTVNEADIGVSRDLLLGYVAHPNVSSEATMSFSDSSADANKNVDTDEFGLCVWRTEIHHAKDISASASQRERSELQHEPCLCSRKDTPHDIQTIQNEDVDSHEYKNASNLVQNTNILASEYSITLVRHNKFEKNLKSTSSSEDIRTRTSDEHPESSGFSLKSEICKCELVDVLGLSYDDNLKNSSYLISATSNETEIVDSINSPLNFCCPEEPHMYADSLDLVQGVNLSSLTTLNSQLYLVNDAVAQQIQLDPYAALHQSSEYDQAEIRAAKQEVLIPNLRDPFQNHTPITIANPEDKLAYNPWTTPLICSTADCSPVRRKQPEVIEEKIACNPWSTAVIEENQIPGTPGLKNEINYSLQTLLLNDTHDISVPVQHPESCDQISETVRLVSEPHSEIKSTTKDAIPEKVYIGSDVHEEDVSIQSCDSQKCKTVTCLSLEIVGNDRYVTCEEQEDRSNSATTIQIAAEIASKAGKIQCEVQNTTPEDCLKIKLIEMDDDNSGSIISTSTIDEFINQDFIRDLDDLRYKQKSKDSVSLCEKNLGEIKSIDSNISTCDSTISTTPEEFINQEFIRDLDYLHYKQKSKDSAPLREENLGEIKSIKYNTSTVQGTDKSKYERNCALFSESTAKENKDKTPKIDIDGFSLSEASTEKQVLGMGSKVNVDLLTDREKQDQGVSSRNSVELEGGAIKLTGKQCSSEDHHSGTDAVTRTNSYSKTQKVADCDEEEVNDENTLSVEFNVTRNEDHMIESTGGCLDCISSIRNITTDITSDTSDVTRKCFVTQKISEVAFSTNLDEDKKGTPRKDQAVNITSTKALADDREDSSLSILNSNAGLNSCILEAQNGKIGKDFSEAKLSPFEDVKIIVLPPSPIANVVSPTTNAEISSSIRERPTMSEQNIFGSSKSPVTKAIEKHSTEQANCLQEEEGFMSTELHNKEDNLSSVIEITSLSNEVTPEPVEYILGISNDEADITTSTEDGLKEHNYEDVLHNNDAFVIFEQNNDINNFSCSQNNDILDLHTSRTTTDPVFVKHDVTKYTGLNKMVQYEESQIETDFNLSEAQMALKNLAYSEGTPEGNTSESQTREISSSQGSGAMFEGIQQTELFEKKIASYPTKTNVLATSKQLETQNVGDILNVTQQQILEDSAFTPLLRNEVDVHVSLQNEDHVSESAISWHYPEEGTTETTNKCVNNIGQLNIHKEEQTQAKIEIYETNERETSQTNWDDVLSPCKELTPESTNTLKCFKSNENHDETDVSKKPAENEIKSIISPIERDRVKERHEDRFINEFAVPFGSLNASGSTKEDEVSPEVISNQEYSDTEIFCDRRSQLSTAHICSVQHDWTDTPYLACRESLPVYDSSHISNYSNTYTHYAESTVYELQHSIDTEFKILEHPTSETPPDFGELVVLPSSRTPEELRFLDATLIDIENSVGMCNELGNCMINSAGAREAELGHENEYLELSLDELQSENEILKHEDRKSNFILLPQSSTNTLELNNVLILNDSLTAASDDDYNTTCNELILTSFETCGSRSEEIHVACFAEAAIACAILDSQPCNSVFASSCPLLAPEDGPVLASSPSQHNVEKGTSFFPDLDDLLSKDFTTYMSSSGDQFHLWPSDVAFGSPSSNLDENIDFDSVLAAPNLEEALRKLEHDIQKRKEEQASDSTPEEKSEGEIVDDKYPNVDTENENLSSSPSIPGNGDDNNLVEEEVNLEEEEEQEEEQENLPDQANGPAEEENLSYDIGDSDYVSLDDIQSSFKHSPESRDTDDSRNDSSYSAGQREEENEGEASCRNRKLRSFEYSQEEREFRHMQGGSNAVISGFMGPAEREIWGILDGNGDDKDKPRECVVCLEETHNDIVSTEKQGISATDDNSDSDENEEEGNGIDWAAALSNIRCYPRVLSPCSAPSMSAIEEENEEDISVAHASPVQLSNIQVCIIKQGSDGDMTNTVSETRDEVTVLVHMDSQEAKEDTFISESNVVPEAIIHSNVEVSCTEEYDAEHAETSYDEPVQYAVIEGIDCIKLMTTGDTINENSDVRKNYTVTNNVKEHYPLRKTDDVSNVNSMCLGLPPRKSVMENELDNTTHNMETSVDVSKSALSNNLEVNDKQALNVNKCSPDNEMQRDITEFGELTPDTNESAYENIDTVGIKHTDADAFLGSLSMDVTKSKVQVLKLLFERDCSPLSANEERNESSDLINSTLFETQLVETTNDSAGAEIGCLNSENYDSVSKSQMVFQGSKGSGRNSEISTQLEDQTKRKCSLDVTVDLNCGSIEHNNQQIYEQHLETPLIYFYTNAKQVRNTSKNTTYNTQPEKEDESCTAEADFNFPDVIGTGLKASMEGLQELQTETCSQPSSVSDLDVCDDALHIERSTVSALHSEEIISTEILNVLNNTSMINLENKDIHKICDSQGRTSKEAIVMTSEMKVGETLAQEEVSTEKFASTVDEIFSEILELDLKDSFDSAEDPHNIIHTEVPDLAAGVNNLYANYTDHPSADSRKAISEISADMYDSVIPRQPIITVTEPTNETLDGAAQLEGIMDNSVATSSEMQLSAASACIARRRQYWDDILRLAIEQKETEEGKVSPQGIQKSLGLTHSEIYRKLCKRNKFAALRSRKPISVRVHGIVNKWRLAFETLKFLEETENKSAEKTERQTGSNVVEQWKKYWDNLVEEQAQIARYKELSKEEITRQYKAGEKRTLQVSGIVAVGRERFEKISSETIEKKCKEPIRKRRPRRLERNINSASPSPERISKTNQNVQHDSKPPVMPGSPESANTGETTLLHFNQNVTSDIRLSPEQVPTSFAEESAKTTKYNSLTFKATITEFEKVENLDSREENVLEIQDKPSTIIIVSNDSLSDACKLQKEHEQIPTLTPETKENFVAGRDVIEKDPETKNRFQKAKQFFQMLEQNSTSKDSSPAPRHRTTGYRKGKASIAPSNSREAWGSTVSLVEPQTSRHNIDFPDVRPSSVNSAPAYDTNWGSIQSLEDKEAYENKVCKGLRSSPSSSTESLSRCLPFKKLRSPIGGSERCAKVYEKFHVEDLFKDVVGEYGRNCGSLKGIPHQQAVLASLQSVGDRCLSPYDEVGSAATSDDEQPYESNMGTSPLPQGYLPEYPYLSTTPARLYRSRSSLVGSSLISRKDLLSVDKTRKS